MALEEQLRKQEGEYKDYVYNLEKKSVLDKDRWAGWGPAGDRQHSSDLLQLFRMDSTASVPQNPNWDLWGWGSKCPGWH